MRVAHVLPSRLDGDSCRHRAPSCRRSPPCAAVDLSQDKEKEDEESAEESDGESDERSDDASEVDDDKDDPYWTYIDGEHVARSRIPVDHAYFNTGIFLPRADDEDEDDDKTQHPHGSWRWLTGMPTPQLKEYLFYELGNKRGIEMQGSRHCLLRKYFHAIESEVDEEGNIQFDGALYCFSCNRPCELPEEEGVDTDEVDAAIAVKVCTRNPACKFVFCINCYRRDVHNDCYGNNTEPGAFDSRCFFCDSRSRWLISEPYGS